MSDIMSKIHLELLDEKGLKIFYNLSAFKDIGYLAGGTALALQINHRRSEDFDIFVNKTIDNKLRLKIKKIFGNVDFYLDNEDQINLLTKDGVKITFLWYYFPRIGLPIRTESISLASIDDIMADKSITIGRRAVWRDYVDVFYVLKNKMSTMASVISLAKKKFKNEFIETQFLEQLMYFDDLEITPIEFVGKPYSEYEVKLFLEQEVKAYVRNRI